MNKYPRLTHYVSEIMIAREMIFVYITVLTIEVWAFSVVYRYLIFIRYSILRRN